MPKDACSGPGNKATNQKGWGNVQVNAGLGYSGQMQCEAGWAEPGAKAEEDKKGCGMQAKGWLMYECLRKA